MRGVVREGVWSEDDDEAEDEVAEEMEGEGETARGLGMTEVTDMAFDDVLTSGKNRRGVIRTVCAKTGGG
jgi:hypothetical protein